jgi:hypothetical protein
VLQGGIADDRVCQDWARCACQFGETWETSLNQLETQTLGRASTVSDSAVTSASIARNFIASNLKVPSANAQANLSRVVLASRGRDIEEFEIRKSDEQYAFDRWG